MSEPAVEYDRRYLGGILFFNERDFFQAHEVWEDLWLDCGGPEGRFFQGLIQAAVALFHFGNGNLRGAVKLYDSSGHYMEPFGSPYLGLDTAAFWRQMERCFAEALAASQAGFPGDQAWPSCNEDLIPVLALDPPPQSWPDPYEFLSESDGRRP